MGFIVDGRSSKRETGSASQPEVVGTLTTNTTAVGNVGGGTDDLMTYSLPAGTLAEQGRAVRIRAWGTAANNANGKTVTLAFGATTLVSTALTASQVGVWDIDAVVIRVGSATQVAVAKLNQGGATTIVDVESTSPTEDLTAAVTIKCTGAATADNDISQKGMVVEYL